MTCLSALLLQRSPPRGSGGARGTVQTMPMLSEAEMTHAGGGSDPLPCGWSHGLHAHVVDTDDVPFATAVRAIFGRQTSAAAAPSAIVVDRNMFVKIRNTRTKLSLRVDVADIS